jgi:hypothetical protein
MLKPLEQFICDKCNGIIENPSQGYVEWESKYSNSKKLYEQWGFKIIHHYHYSPFKKEDGRGAGCYHYENSPNRSDLDLEHFMGKCQISELLSFLDVGPYHNKDYSGSSIIDLREYVEFFRRLTIPYYEEARFYWNQAINDGFFGDANEIWIYLPENLEHLIKKYRK